MFLKRLSVLRADVANVFNVTFESEDANKAAVIANAIADTYVSSTQAARVTSLKLANQLLQDRLVELKDQATEADEALQKYKVANNLMESDSGRPLYDEVVNELVNATGLLTKARVAAAEAKARLERVQATRSSRSNEEISRWSRATALSCATEWRMRRRMRRIVP